MNRHSTGSAFTLIEVLLATSLSMIVITGALFTLSTMLRAYESRSGVSQAAETANLILNRIRTDLTSTRYSLHEDDCTFFGLDASNGVMDTDRLIFTSWVNDPVALGQGTSDVAEIEYFLDSDDSTPARWLQRRFDSTPDDDPLTGGTIALLGPRVESFNALYYDGLAWWPEWDSETELPMAVNITIALFYPEEIDQAPTPEALQQFSTTIWLAAYREPSGGGGGESATGEAGGGR